MIQAITERTGILVNDNGIATLENANIFVAGCGGVGAYVIEGLVRAGVGNLTIVDSDVVKPSNINRQLIALHSTLGKYKVDVVKQRILDINPNCNVTVLKTFINPENTVELLTSQKYDYTIDAIDTLNAKVNLLKHSHELSIRTISSMGAGGKIDPTQIKVTDIYKTEVCPLARVIRIRLKRLHVPKGILCVFSTERNMAPLPPVEEEGSLGRARATNGTMSYMPSIFGLTIAGIVIKNIVGDDFNNEMLQD